MAKANTVFCIGDQVTVFNAWSLNNYKGVIVAIVPEGEYAEDVVWSDKKIFDDKIAFRQGVTYYDYETYVVRRNDTGKLVRPLAHSIMLDKRVEVKKAAKKPKATKVAKSTNGDKVVSSKYVDGALKMDGKQWAPLFEDNAPYLKRLMKEAVKEVLADLFSTSGKV